jgi:hypothetical protein
LNRKSDAGDDYLKRYSGWRESDIGRALALSIRIAASIAESTGPAMAQVCTRDGPVVNCDDGRRGLLSGDAIIWADGTRSSASPHSGVVIGNKSSVMVGPGVFVGKGNGVVPLDDSQCAEQDALRHSGWRAALLLMFQ